ncbi:hypothetical protein [Natrinema salifodinae]|uniref:DUF7982 domain-containing protein n=1 Tax=Natrinema salifodinae TaxID=1202768 RepID=A0A1I0M6B5_9EURY|nr:hypothetical protein [Natrinema salifodinae]SEV83819.1 hypothetical protein SAMN05216285_0536 [Natrinema salifodinae]
MSTRNASDERRIDPETDDATANDGATADGPADGDDDLVELAARAELLEAENRRLRTEYARVRRAQYRRTAAGLALIGVLAALAAVPFPDGRAVLFALAATGLFGGVLTYYLTPGAFVAADVGERIYAATATNQAAIADELGLGDDRVYLPADAGAGARLYVPQRATDDRPLPAREELDGPIATDRDHRGLVLEPTGATLFEEFERTLTDPLATDPGQLATQLADGLVEQFELAARADPDADPADGRVTVAVGDSAFGDVDRFDHPIASFLAVGVAAGLDRPVRLSIAPGDEQAEWLVTCRWDDRGVEEDAGTIDANATAVDETEASGTGDDESSPEQ